MKKLAVIFLLFPLFGISQVRYFAEIKVDTVSRVLIVSSENYVESLLGGNWVETFISDPIKNYAGVGYIYYPAKQNFSPKKPFPSWTLDVHCNWQPPITYPVARTLYQWYESTLTWTEIN